MNSADFYKALIFITLVLITRVIMYEAAALPFGDVLCARAAVLLLLYILNNIKKWQLFGFASAALPLK